MTNAKAIIIGFSLVASSLLFTRGIEPAKAFGGGTFTAVSSDADGSSVWVLNTDNGDLRYCFRAVNIVCTLERK